jgi:hypothetical protein
MARRTFGVQGVDERAQVADLAVDAGVLQQGGKAVVGFKVGSQVAGVYQVHGDAQRLGAGLDHFQRLREDVVADDETGGLALATAGGQGHGFGGGRGLVQHGSVGNGHAGEVGHHGLEVDQGFHAALGDFSLVGRVGGVPGGVLEDVAQDDAGDVGAVVALTDEVAHHLVLLRDGLEFGQCLRFGHWRGQVHRGRAADAGRHDARP